MSDLHFLDNSSASLRKEKKVGDTTWAVSFADIVTVLLCFFIIFYMLEKQLTKKNIGFGNNQGTIQNYKPAFETLEMKSLMESIKSLDLATFYQNDKFMEIRFKPKSFFDSGKTTPTQAGLELIDTVIPSLLKLGKNYRLQIQGYTDRMPVKPSSKRWWRNNMQLSLVRSLSVYEHLIEKGVNKELISIVGHGENSSGRSISSVDRRITLRIEPVAYEN